MVKIPLTKNKFATIDKKVVALVEKFTWHFDGRYAATTKQIDGKLKKIYMHRLIAPHFKMIDHANQDKLDNRLSNLRETNKSKNALNSRFAGITFVKTGKRRKRWNAQIRVGGKHISLGHYFTPDEAKAAYQSYKASVINGKP